MVHVFTGTNVGAGAVRGHGEHAILERAREHGLLRLTVPKAEAAKPRRITVEVSRTDGCIGEGAK